MEEESSQRLLQQLDRSPQASLGKQMFTHEDIEGQAQAAEEAQIKREEEVSGWSVLSTAWQQESAAFQAVAGGVEDAAPDPNYEPTKEHMVSWQDGIEEHYWPQYNEATSEIHAANIKKHLLDTQEKDKIINSHGMWTGIGARLLGATFDPAAWGATVASEGFLVPFIFANKVGRIASIAKHGLGAAAANVAVDGVLIHQRPDMEWKDAIYSAAGGMVIGGLVGGLKKLPVTLSPEHKAVNDAWKEMHNAVLKSDAAEDGIPLTDKGLRQLGGDEDSFNKAVVQATGNRLNRGQRKTIHGQVKNLTYDLNKKLEELSSYVKAHPKIAKAGQQLSQKKTHNQLSKAEEKINREVASIQEELDILQGKLGKDAAARDMLKDGEASTIIKDARKEHRSPSEALDDITTKRGEGVSAPVTKMWVDGKEVSYHELNSADRAIAEDIGISSSAEQPSSASATAYMDDDIDYEAAEAAVEAGSGNGARTPLEAATDIDEIINANMPGFSFAAAFRFDRASWGGASKIPLARYLSNILYEDGAGLAEKSLVRDFSAELTKRTNMNRVLYHNGKSMQVNFKGWLEEQGKSSSFHNFRGLDTRALFNEEVAKVIRGKHTDSTYIKAHADHQADAYKQIIEKAKEAKVVGVEKLETNANYVPRIWSAAKLMEASKRLGHDVVIRRIARSLTVEEGVDANIVAEGIYRVIQRSKGGGVNVARAISTVDVDRLKSLLRQEGLEDTHIDEFVASMRGGKVADTSNINRLRQRIKLDEMMDVDDFFDNNSEALFHNYVNSMTGHIALAEKGIFSESHFKLLMERIQERLVKDNQSLDSWKSKEVLANLQEGYDSLIGRPLETDPSNPLAFAGRTLRKMGFGQNMGQVGFAQLPEMGIPIAQLGLKVLSQHVPEMTKTFKRLATDGSFADELAEDLDAALGGWSSGALLGTPSNQMDEMGSLMGGGRQSMQRMEAKLDQVNFAVAHQSGFFAVNQVEKQLAMKGMAQKWLNDALSATTVTRTAEVDGVTSTIASRTHRTQDTMSEARFNDLGISSEMRLRVEEQLRRHAVTNDNGKLIRMPFENWDDMEAKEAFTYGMRRWGESMIQDPSMGSSWRYLDNNAMGKIVSQFRGFVIGAYAKHTLRGAKFADFQFAQEVMWSMAIGALVYETQQRLTTLGRSDRKKLLKERLTTEKVIANAFAKTAASSFLAPVMETLASPFLQGDGLTHRTSGLGQAISVDSTPAFKTLGALSGTIYGGAAALFDSKRDWNQADQRRLHSLLPMRNHILMQYFLEENFVSTKPKNH